MGENAGGSVRDFSTASQEGGELQYALGGSDRSTDRAHILLIERRLNIFARAGAMRRRDCPGGDAVRLGHLGQVGLVVALVGLELCRRRRRLGAAGYALKVVCRGRKNKRGKKAAVTSCCLRRLHQRTGFVMTHKSQRESRAARRSPSPGRGPARPR